MPDKNNLEGEQQFTVEGLEDKYGKELFLTLARRHFKNVTPEIEKSLENLSQQISGHPLSIKLLSGSYRRIGISEMKAFLITWLLI